MFKNKKPVKNKNFYELPASTQKKVFKKAAIGTSILKKKLIEKYATISK